MVREVHRRILAEVPGLIDTSRLNVYDAIEYPYGWGVERH